MNSLKILFLIAVVLLLNSCNSSKNVVYVQNSGAKVDLSQSILPTLPEITIKNGDVLMITISSYISELSAPFNGSSSTPNSDENNQLISGYLVDNQGNINFPILGRINVVGKTKNQIEEMIQILISPKYITDVPTVSVRLTNFKVTVLGDINGSRIIPVVDDRISIFEAIAQGGDLQLTGKRDRVLLIRENSQGKRETYRIDLRDKKLIDSPFYYLQQNDLLYIEPNSSKASNANTEIAKILAYITPFASILSVIAILTRN